MPMLETAAKAEPATVHVEVGDKGGIDFQVAEDQSEAPCFALGVRKSGSTMLHKLVMFLARKNNTNAVDIPGTFFKRGYVVQDWVKADLSHVVQRGNVYVGFRSYPTNFDRYEHFRNGRKIFMFRDPRDALVSQYFSDAYSHSLPSKETEVGAKATEAFLKKREETLATDIETYVMKHAKSFDSTLMQFAPLLDDPTCLTLRYEDYIFQKKRLIHKILNHFEWSCAPGHIEALLKTIDEVPSSEDKQRFVRRVIPGDHRNKLTPEAIRKLNNRLKDVMHLFDYY
jgi:hypothetical protein